MKILITGAKGMVARACVTYCLSLGDNVTALSHKELDIADREAVSGTFAAFSPEAVINCAAYTDVDGAETNIDTAFAANSLGVENLATACSRSGAVFVTISTDYVFEGAKDGFYDETDTPNPQSVYARSKLEGEQRAADENPDSIIVRSGWIYGDGGTNFLSVMPRLLADGKRIKAIRDSYGTPTFAADLAHRLRELADLRVGGIYHAVNSGPGTSYLGFAEKVCDIGDLDIGLIEAVADRDLMRPAPRPVNSRLACRACERLGLGVMSDWEDALRRYLCS